MKKNEVRCKRIIGGKTYNTETATLVASWSNMDDPYDNVPAEISEILYQTRHGAYFLYLFDQRFDPWERSHEGIKPLTPEDAREWMEKNSNADLIEKHFGEMPEAGEAESRFTLRMPDSLKQQVDAAAKAKKQSANAWIVRCLENCVASESQ